MQRKEQLHMVRPNMTSRSIASYLAPSPNGRRHGAEVRSGSARRVEFKTLGPSEAIGIMLQVNLLAGRIFNAQRMMY